jgi:hypothetical protein
MPRRVFACAIALAIAFAGVSVGRADAPAGRYVVDSGTVRDTKTGLTWQRNVEQGKYPAASTCTSGMVCDAMTYCANLTVNGVTGWRLPTVQELLTIVDETRHSPAIDTTAFPASTPIDDLFDSQSVYSPSFPGAWWGVSFDYGVSLARYTMTPGYVRCVQTFGSSDGGSGGDADGGD